MGINSQDLILLPTVIFDKAHHLFGPKFCGGTFYRYQSDLQWQAPAPFCYFLRKNRQPMAWSHPIRSVHITDPNGFCLWSVIVCRIQDAHLPPPDSSLNFKTLAQSLRPTDPCLLQIEKRVLFGSASNSCIQTGPVISPDRAQGQLERGGNTRPNCKGVQDIHQHLAAGVERAHYTLTQIEYNVFQGICIHNTSSIPLDGCLGGGFYLPFLLFSGILNNLVNTKAR